MGKLKVLPANIANLIAAGEVVQRPASVVKELMENSVDAGADRIDVVVKDSGKTLIQVIDNGCGMSPADAVLCFERHATSKIADASDLEGILTYGFRGEALPSMAAVSEITLKTRRKDSETATEVSIASDGSLKTAACAAPVGSSFAIRNLFFNTPARRKFLKSDSVELRHILDEFIRIAIPHPEIRFSLSHNGREIYVLNAAKSLKFRIQDIFGTTHSGELADISTKTSVAGVSGFIAKPDSARKTVANQFFFVGGRYFRSPYLHKAVMKAYEELLPEGFSPSYFIFLDIDPSSVDVNIHPTKTEIKFEDDSIMFQLLYASVKEVLGRNSFGASIDFDTEGSVELPKMDGSFAGLRGSVPAPTIGTDPYYDPFSPSSGAASPKEDNAMKPNYDFSSSIGKSDNYGALFEDSAVRTGKAMTLGGKFVVTAVSDGLLLVNARRAMERILYDDVINALEGGSPVAQRSLFPENVRVGVSARLLFDENSSSLKSMGFDMEPMGNDSVVVNAVPDAFACGDATMAETLANLAEILSDSSRALPEMLKQTMAGKIAALGASGYVAPSSPVEASVLIDRLFKCANAEYSPRGTKIAVTLNIEEIERKF